MYTLESILQTACQTTPAWQVETAFNPTADGFAGIQAITYDGITVESGKTTTFAYLGIPAGASEETPVPAIVLVHGGGGRPYLPWVKMWNERGYAAIAISTSGLFPNGVNAGSMEAGDPDYLESMYDSFVKEGYVDSPYEDAMRNPDLPITERWITHALVKTIHAHNLLRSLKEVDNSKIGITGISWGGTITSIAITYDPRFAFAIPVYGSSYLTQSLSYMGPIFQNPGNAQFRSEDRIDRVKIPVLWLAWNDDNCFSINSSSLSYLATVPSNPKTSLCFVHLMRHDHRKGWGQPVIDAFADWVVRDTQPLITFLSQPEGKNAEALLNIPAGIDDVEAKLYWIDAPMTTSPHDKYDYGVESESLTFMDQVWQISPATISGNKVSVTLPDAARGYYLEISYKINGRQMYATSVYTTR